jgi:hypothetical protein
MQLPGPVHREAARSRRHSPAEEARGAHGEEHAEDAGQRRQQGLRHGAVTEKYGLGNEDLKRFLSFGKKNRGREVTVVIDCTSPSVPSLSDNVSASGGWN